MRWHDLLFMHWPLPEDSLQPLIPPALKLDTFDGSAWLGVVPFRMTGVRPRYLPAVRWLSSFPELNVRTYVTHEDKPGIWFFSLDASRRAAVEGARATYRLPYFHASMSCERRGSALTFRSRRVDRRGREAELSVVYEPRGEPSHARPATLEHFLTERYCLYTIHDERIHRAEIHHPPWPLQPAEAEIELNTMAPDGIELGDEQPLLHFAARQDVVIWPLEPT